MSLTGLRELMGHARLDTTLVYARLADSTLEHQYRAAMEQLTARVTDARVTDDRVTDDRVTDDRVTDSRVTELVNLM